MLAQLQLMAHIDMTQHLGTVLLCTSSGDGLARLHETQPYMLFCLVCHSHSLSYPDLQDLPEPVTPACWQLMPF